MKNQKKMKNVTKIMFIGALSVLFGLSCLQATASHHRGLRADLKRIDVDHAHVKQDLYNFLYNYKIVVGLHANYEYKLGSLPANLQKDSETVKAAYEELRNFICKAAADEFCIANDFSEQLQESSSQAANLALAAYIDGTESDSFYQDALENVHMISEEYSSTHN